MFHDYCRIHGQIHSKAYLLPLRVMAPDVYFNAAFLCIFFFFFVTMANSE